MAATSTSAPLRTRRVIARGASRQPRTYRLSPRPAQQAVYRRLATAILGLDVATVADELCVVRRFAHMLAHAA